MSAAFDRTSTPELAHPRARAAVLTPTLRVLAETSPAPTRTGSATDIPSTRPTSVPDFDPSVLAEATGLRYANTSPMPMDLSVPVRLGGLDEDGEGLTLRDAFILLHVDGVSSAAEIAMSAGLPINEVVETLLALVASGMVGLDGQATNDQSCPQSGVHRRPTFAELGLDEP